MSSAGDGNRIVYDTISGTTGERLSVHKDEKSGETIVPYSNGAEVTWQRTAVGDDGRLKEIRTVTKVKTPHKMFTMPGDAYDRIFRRKEKGTT